jgi:hypothetical protein
MAVIPSFNSYAPAPELAQAYLGAERIRQEAAADAARIALGREQLAQQAVQANMELQAKQEALANESLRRAQEQQIEQAYKQTQLGLAERELKSQEAYNQSRIAEAAEGFSRRQAYDRGVAEKVARGIPLSRASQETMLEVGIGETGFGSAQGTGTPGRMADRDRIMLQSAARRLEQARRFAGEARGSKIPAAQKELEEAQVEFDRLNAAPSPAISAGGLPAPTGVPQQQAAPMVLPGNEQGFIGIESGPNLYQHTPSSGLLPPSTMTATNAPGGKRLRFNRATGEFE